MKGTKKLLIVVLALAMLVALSTIVKATTPNEELYAYFKDAEYTIGGKTYTIDDDKLREVEKYLNNHELTAEQVSEVKTSVESAASTLKSEGTIDVSELSSSAKTSLESVAAQLENTLGIEIGYEDGAFTVKEDGKLLMDPITASGTLVQTGHSYIPYIVASLVAIVAIAIFTSKKVWAR